MYSSGDRLWEGCEGAWKSGGENEELCNDSRGREGQGCTYVSLSEGFCSSVV